MDKNTLKSMSRKELGKLLADVKKALQSVKARDQREAKKAAAKAAAQYGFSLDEISDVDRPKKNGLKEKSQNHQQSLQACVRKSGRQNANLVGKGAAT